MISIPTSKRSGLLVVLLLVFLNRSVALCQGTPAEVPSTQLTYTGFVHQASHQPVPIMIRVWNLNHEKVWHGAFVLGIEAGPYPFDAVTYDPVRNTLYVINNIYNAGQAQLAWEVKLSANSDHSLSGKLVAPRGVLGIVDLKLDQDAVFDKQPFLQGVWSGNCQSPDQHDLPAKLVLLSSAPVPPLKPNQGDLAWAPVKAGSLSLGGLAIGISSCAVDYFAGTIGCILAPPHSVGTQPPGLGLKGDFDYSNRTIKVTLLGYNGNSSCGTLKFGQP